MRRTTLSTITARILGHCRDNRGAAVHAEILRRLLELCLGTSRIESLDLRSTHFMGTGISGFGRWKLVPQTLTMPCAWSARDAVTRRR